MSVYERAGVLFRQLHGALGTREDLQLGNTVARPVFVALLPAVRGSATIPGAAALLALLLELFGPFPTPKGTAFAAVLPLNPPARSLLQCMRTSGCLRLYEAGSACMVVYVHVPVHTRMHVAIFTCVWLRLSACRYARACV